jgi:hypothetical protein
VNRTKKLTFAALALVCAAATAEPNAAEESAELTAKNIALVSSALAAHQKGVNAMAATRAENILSVTRLASNAQSEVEREVAVLKQTGGAGIVGMFDALREYGDRAALLASQADAAEAAAKADITGAYTPLGISTEKLDAAAKTLAVLAKQQTQQERARYLVHFLRDTRDESRKLLNASEDKRDTADKDLDAAAKAAANATNIAGPKTGK